MKTVRLAWLVFLAACSLFGGDYSVGVGGVGEAVDEPIPGFTGEEGDGIIPNGYYDEEGNFVSLGGAGANTVNPAFVGWATYVVSYEPANATLIDAAWKDTSCALGPVTGDNYDVVSLGELKAEDIAAGATPGSITLGFGVKIKNGEGADFAVFENAFFGSFDFGSGDYPEFAGVFMELAYVEVSTDGVNFARFPCVSNNEQFDVGDFSSNNAFERARAYANRDATNVYNLAGKHVNNGGESWGTPFDLDDLKGHPLVQSGTVDLNDIRYVRIVDIPGSGDYLDSNGHPIYDAWVTYGSGGFDLEAVGVIHGETLAYDSFADWAAARIPDVAVRGALQDADGDGLPNLLEYALGKNPTACEVGTPIVCETANGACALIFERPAGVGGVSYAVCATDDVAGTPTEIAAGVDSLEPIDGAATVEETLLSNGNTRVRVEDAMPPSANAPRFLRLKVTTTAP